MAKGCVRRPMRKRRLKQAQVYCRRDGGRVVTVKGDAECDTRCTPRACP